MFSTIYNSEYLILHLKKKKKLKTIVEFLIDTYKYK